MYDKDDNQMNGRISDIDEPKKKNHDEQTIKKKEPRALDELNKKNIAMPPAALIDEYQMKINILTNDQMDIRLIDV